MPIQETVAAEFPVTIKNDDYTLLPGDIATEIQFDKATSVTATLPPIASIGNGYNVILRNIGAGTLTISGNSALVDGAASVNLNQGDSIWLRGDGTAWKSIASGGNGGGGGGGKVVQVAVGTSTTETTVTATSYASGGLTVSITPTSAENSILLMAQTRVVAYGDGTNIAAREGWFSIFDGDPSSSGVLLKECIEGRNMSTPTTGTEGSFFSATLIHQHSPGDTISHIYYFAIKAATGCDIVAQHEDGLGTFVAMEIAS
jgi:hypothetical protein